jgi:cell wall-associated NlpC family hydrolase
VNHASTGAPWRARILRGTLTSVLALGLAVGVSPLAPTATADAAVSHSAKKKAEKKKDKAGKVGREFEGRPVEDMTAKPLPPRGERVLRVARAQAGDPYAWGGAGPNRFDCSGLTQYAYRAVGKALPHSSSAQVGRTNRISRAAARPGDLVFFHSGGSVYHVAIYAGKNMVWHAPGTGQRVTRAKIWTGSVFFGRVR